MSELAQYSISDLAHYTGIKSHTIRIWEKRYNLLNPQRSCTNIRGYSGEELRKLLNINTLLQTGWKISKISTLTTEQLDTQVRQVLTGSLDTQKSDCLINGLMVHMLNFDEVRFVEVFDQANHLFGLKKTILEIIYPFLKKVGVLWQVNDLSPSQEHFASAIIRRKILLEIDILTKANNSKYSFILCLPPEDFHELPLLLAHYILLENKITTYYLGSSVSPDMAAQAAHITGATHLFTLFMSSSPMEKLKDYMQSIHQKVPNLNILFSGCPEMCKKPLLNQAVRHLKSIDEFETIVESLA